MKNTISIIHTQEVLGKDFQVYGSTEEPLFKSVDVAQWIEHNNPTLMVSKVDEDEKKLDYVIHTSGQRRKTMFLTEHGVYEVLMQSRKPIAKQFKKQVKLILKQIRITGGYIPVAKEDSPSEIMAKALLIAQKTLDEKDTIIAKQEKTIKVQAPKVEEYNHYMEADKDIEIGQLAKSLNIKDMGRNNLFKYLRHKKILQIDNEPYQNQVKNGNFRVVHRMIKTPYDTEIPTIKTYITPKGMSWLYKKLKKEGYIKVA